MLKEAINSTSVQLVLWNVITHKIGLYKKTSSTDHSVKTHKMKLPKSTPPVILIVVTILVKGTIPTSDISRNGASSDRDSCTSVEAIPLCTDLGYVNTTFPNLRGHTTAEEANEELAHFLGLVSTGCSNAIVHLLCSIYAPMCIQEYPDMKFPPCRNLCEHVANGCSETFMLVSGYNWPPGPHLDCYNYDDRDTNSLCFGPQDLSILEIPFHMSSKFSLCCK